MSVVGEMIEINLTGGTAKGYYAKGKTDDVKPGLIVIQEWWGLNDHIKDVANRFAEKGYAVLAPDLYKGKVTKAPTEAGALMQGLNQDYALEVLNKSVDYLQTAPGVNGERIGVTGFCMGGSFALLLPCVNKNIKAAAPFYGDVPSEAKLRDLEAPVLFIGAENDFWITGEKMEGLREALKKFGKTGEVKIYQGVGHAFFNDTRPDAYDESSAKDAWERVNHFFAQHLK
ncbi:MAG: dienelactone hydrolase family protein [Acidobacteriota bacterium]